jgi:UTP--glucose-1-phosphate uridylyltransferase
LNSVINSTLTDTATPQLFISKMKREGQPQAVIDIFLRYYDALRHGKTGYIAESDIDPVTESDIAGIADIEDLHVIGEEALKHAVVIKLNGGLGTSMGLSTAKSLIPVKNGLSFLDITALQIRSLNSRFGLSIPLIMMNSFNTESDTEAALKRYRDIIKTGIPSSFIQNKFPKINAADMSPVEAPHDRRLEWNPPGHGDLYAAIQSSGVLDTLLNGGYKYAFISNIDNLGAALDTRILGYFADRGIHFLMEVTDRTFMDRKGGHIARLKNGQLALREAAQCPPESIDRFMDTDLHRYFNTNNLWIRLDALREIWDRDALTLPMIRNVKKLDTRDTDSPDVIQLESAMGSALSVFENADALRVPRSRFAPVKNCEELLLLWSDYYDLTEDCRIMMNQLHKSIQMNVLLEPRFYGTLDKLKERFPAGAPSLVNCESLSVFGDVKFGKGIVITGQTSIINTTGKQAFIDDGRHLTGEVCI